LPKVLYIEDEPFLGKIVKETLENQGFRVLWKMNGKDILHEVRSFEPDICVLDIMLPDIDGYQLCRQVRNRFPTIPVIFLTAKTETSDLVKGFEAGGTDYMRKPFSIGELIVRIHNQLTLASDKSTGIRKITEEIALGTYIFLADRCELITPTRTIRLSHRDMEVISMLANHARQVVDRKTMLKTIWGDDSFFNSRTLDVYIRKIRGYFSEDNRIEIITMKGKGYLFLAPDNSE